MKIYEEVEGHIGKYHAEFTVDHPKKECTVLFVAGEDKTAKPLAVAAKEFKQPNGLIGTPDGRTLYVADIGAAKTYAFDVQPDGGPPARRAGEGVGRRHGAVAGPARRRPCGSGR